MLLGLVWKDEGKSVALTLDDILAAPNDPLALNRHLQDRGLIPLPPPPAPPPTIAPMTPPVVHPAIAPMIPPAEVTPLSSRGEGLAIGATSQPVKPLSKIESLAAAPDLGGAPAAPGLITPPAAPTAHELGKVTPLSARGAGLAAGATSQPVLPAPGKLESLNAPELGATAAPEPGIVSPMTPPKMPTPQESIAAGIAERGGGTAKEEGKRQFQELRPVVTAPPNSSEFWTQKMSQAEFDKAHPWGADISAHPGALGKIGHVLGNIAQTAGGIVAPGVVANIPGTRMNRAIGEQAEAAEQGKALEREGQAESRATQAKNVESEAGLRGAQQKEAEQKTAKEASEQSLEKDAQGNVVGWADAKGVKHSIDEEGTPQAIKDIAAASANKEGPRIEKSANGDIVQITTDKDGKATSNVVYHGDPKVETDLTSRTVNGQEHRILINKATGEDIKDLGAFKTEESPAAKLKAEQAGEEPVIGFDKDGIQRIMPRSQAEKEGLTHVVKSSPKDRADSEQNTSALNDMTAKVKNIVKSSEAIDKLGAGQKTLIQTALNGHPDDYKTRFAVSMMAPEAKQYVQDVFSLREASLGLPKQITGGSRVSEPQATALFNTIPGSSGDHAYRLSQLKKFDENLNRLSKKVPRVEGNDLERAFPEEKGGGANAGPPGPPAPGMKWQQNKKTGEYRQVKANG